MIGLTKTAEASQKTLSGSVVCPKRLGGFSILRTCKDSCFMKRIERSFFLQFDEKFALRKEDVEKGRLVC